jgi:hypothetical protein
LELALFYGIGILIGMMYSYAMNKALAQSKPDVPDFVDFERKFAWRTLNAERRLCRELVYRCEADLSIVDSVVRSFLPKRSESIFVKTVNKALNNKGLRHQMFNELQMKKAKLSRIN